MGFKVNIEPGHSTTSSSALAQVFQFDDSRCALLILRVHACYQSLILYCISLRLAGSTSNYPRV